MELRAPLLPFLLLVFSCQCQRSGSLNGPDGYRTHSSLSLSLSPFSSPSCPPLLKLQFFLSPPYQHVSLLTPLSVLALFCLSHGAVAEDTPSCPRLCCQAFPKLNFLSLMVVCLWHRLPGKWKKCLLKDPSLPCSSFASSSSFSSWSSIQPDTDAFTFFKKQRGEPEGLSASQNQQASPFILSGGSLKMCSIAFGEIYSK